MIPTVIVLVAAAVGLAILVRWLEPRFAFFPSPGEDATPAHSGVAFTSHTVRTEDDEQLRVWQLQGAAGSRRLIVYFHGNGGNLSAWEPILSGIAKRGYSVIAADYRGYGLSTGRPTERGLYRDADAILKHVSTIAPAPAQVIYWGRSLGTPVAAYAATRRPPDGLILEAGFPDARSLLRSSSPVLAFLALFGTYRFPTAELLSQVRAPILVLHGDADRIVPYHLGRALFDRITGPRRFVTIRGGDHNDAEPMDPRVYWDAVDELIRATPAH